MFEKLRETFKSTLSSLTKGSLDTYCFLETAITDTPIIVAADGSLMTIIRIDGTKKMISDADLPEIIENMTIKLSSYFDNAGHAMQVWFSRDPDGSKDLISGLTRPARTVAKNLDLDLQDLFDEREPPFKFYRQ